MRRKSWLTHLLALGALTITAAHAQEAKPARYHVIDLGTLGGTYSYSYGISATGVVAGGAATEDQTDQLSQTAFLSNGWHKVPIGTIDGASCPTCSSEAGGPNIWGEAPVISETANFDPNGEDFCGFGTHRQCLAAVWRSGTLKVLPVLEGGHNSQAYWNNDLGEVVGFSETGTPDSNCLAAYQRYRYVAVKWEPRGGVRILRPLDGDTVSFAFTNNEKGEVVGISGLCSNTSLPPNSNPGGPHAVLWDRSGTPHDLGALPGAIGSNVAGNINDLGHVAGTSVLSDGTVHTFLWTKTAGMKDIGTPPGAFVTVAPCCNSLNNKDEITGFAVDADGPFGFVWKGGQFTDLNTEIPAGSPWYILNTASINDAGQIAATGLNTETGEVHAVLLKPIPRIGAPGAKGMLNRPPLPFRVRQMMDKKRD